MKDNQSLGGGEPFTDARVLLAKYGLEAKKAFGQNFLVNERVFRAIVDATVVTNEDWIVEIGAGLGTLTARLAERVPEGKVIALERDPDMVMVLRSELGNVENVQIEAVDALAYDVTMVARWRGEKVAVAGNLPYHIAAPLMFKMVEKRAAITRAVVMIQKEMADRIVASPGTKEYGALGVMLCTYMDAKTVAKVGPGSFVPPPKIDSTVLRLTPLPHGGPRVTINDEAHYAAIVHAGFGQRRKTLRNSLRAAFNDDAVEAAFTATGIDGGRRAETLEIAEFAALANHIAATERKASAPGIAGRAEARKPSRAERLAVRAMDAEAAADDTEAFADSDAHEELDAHALENPPQAAADNDDTN